MEKRHSALVHGRERIYLEHFWNDFARQSGSLGARARSPEFMREAYARPGGMRAGFEYFRAFEKDAEDFAPLCTHSRSPCPCSC